MGTATTALPDILQKITARRLERLAAAARETGELPELAPGPLLTAADNAFLASLEARRGRAVIAEVKLGSPRLGRLTLDAERQAGIYAAHGAAALSVVVEPDFFFGSYELLATCRRTSGLPAIAKDFIVHPLQLWWAKRAAADAVLLIAALYTAEELACWAGMARRLGLVPLIELHDASDLAKLAGGDWELVGVNNRDLRTFEVSLEASMALVPALPARALKVAESGIASRVEVHALAAAGFDAFLIGESLLLADDPAAKLRELLH